ncbi:PhzF family phenazine biosynthesis isomerase [Streptacidiphilus fuscans]|uniref:PhzF family phenazine biosynthesis isomerase n=1 Tax=Streptacidiphilus fuscans TaxID=2789292 RepID=A0A931FFR2_9ACTN|nr:PhzF family phenazine biosynthesis isomerase [Streptacidiphilus fuscans]MBF9070550.1 PhzF family phenazine biosynthesis isomerase [Streptacidiphilus fuscans]
MPGPVRLTSDVLRYTAFSTDPAGGNPAGVVLDARGVPDADMLTVAAEVGYSESAFVTERDEERRRFRLRYFSPLAEVAFCGHATVATAVALAQRLGEGSLLFDTAAGEIAVETAKDGDGVIRATLTSAPTRSRPVDAAVLAEALALLRWAPEDLDGELPPCVAFGGVEHLVLAVRSRSRLAALDYDFDGLAGLMDRQGWTTVQLVWRESPELYHARDPFPIGGVVEDPATGAAAAAFGGYLRDLGALPSSGAFTIRQGEDMGRPSTLAVTASPDDERVRVSGAAVAIG